MLCALQYDPEGFGEIPWDDFLEVLNNPEFVAEVDANKRDILLERAQERATTAITFQDFVNVVSHSPPLRRSFFLFLCSSSSSFHVLRGGHTQTLGHVTPQSPLQVSSLFYGRDAFLDSVPLCGCEALVRPKLPLFDLPKFAKSPLRYLVRRMGKRFVSSGGRPASSR